VAVHCYYDSTMNIVVVITITITIISPIELKFRRDWTLSKLSKLSASQNIER